MGETGVCVGGAETDLGLTAAVAPGISDTAAGKMGDTEHVAKTARCGRVGVVI